MNDSTVLNRPHSRVISGNQGRLVLTGRIFAVIGVLFAWGVALREVAVRNYNIGTDTQQYLALFERIGSVHFETRLEPGFVLFVRLLHGAGAGPHTYQAALFLLLLASIALAVHELLKIYPRVSERMRVALLMSICILSSPVFVSSAINAVRQGISAGLIIGGIAAFSRGRILRTLAYAGTACSVHYSSALFFCSALLLLLRRRSLAAIIGTLVVAYASGLSSAIVRVAFPSLYAAVMNYVPEASYRSGTRLDFLAFSLGCGFVPVLGSLLLNGQLRRSSLKIADAYFVLLVPFLLLGWGNFSNRFLLPPWILASLGSGVVFSHLNLPLTRSRFLLSVFVLISGFWFCYMVRNQIIL